MDICNIAAFYHEKVPRVGSSNVVLEALDKYGKRLDSLTARVEGSDSSSSMPSRASQTSEPSRDWGQRDVDKRP